MDKGRQHRAASGFCDAGVSSDRDDPFTIGDEFVWHGREAVEIAAERLEETCDDRIDATHLAAKVGRPFRLGPFDCGIKKPERARDVAFR
jgi:hypothetical protein